VEQELGGRAALVTGASRGIGAATAIALAKKGVQEFLLQYNLNPAGAEEVAAAVRAAGAKKAQTIQADLGTVAGIDGFIEHLRKISSPIDILVNNAGSLVKRAKLLEMSDDIYDRIMNLNVKSAWQITQAVVPGMIEKGSGYVIFLSSIAARNGGGPGATIYSAAKAAVSAMTKGLAKELAPKGIRVNAVSPGTVDNYFHEQFSTRSMLDQVVAATPAGRLGTNEEIADTIVFLCSGGARFIHGQTIEINGGTFMI
jgi:3-oxoacyl-[acyl-carrier protein] reductase